jgi:hypothetical protein
MASLGTFSERALAAYDELVRREYKEKKVKGGQGTEYADNLGVGENDSSFIDEDEGNNPNDYSESWDFTTCVRSNGSLYGIAPGKKCRKGSETKSVTKEDKQREALKRKVQKEIESNPRMSYLKKAVEGRKNAIAKRESFIKENKYPAANAGIQKEIEKAKKELENLNKDILRERRRIAKQVVDEAKKPTRAQRLGRLSATKARAEKVLADLRKEKEETPTQKSGKQGIFNKSQWD